MWSIEVEHAIERWKKSRKDKGDKGDKGDKEEDLYQGFCVCNGMKPAKQDKEEEEFSLSRLNNV